MMSLWYFMSGSKCVTLNHNNSLNGPHTYSLDKNQGKILTKDHNMETYQRANTELKDYMTNFFSSENYLHTLSEK